MSKRTLLVLAAIAALSCKGKVETEGKSGSVETSPKAEPGEEPAATPDDGKLDPATRKKAIEETLAAVPDIQKQVAELRELQFKSDVPAAHQTQDDFRKFVQGEIKAELPPDKSMLYTRALHRIGLLKSAERDLASLLEDALVTQAGAYYDPKQKKFFVVMVSTNAMERNTITAHELTHALQDQHFDLAKYYGEGQEPKLTEDQLNARRFIVEGEATVLMLAQVGKGMMNVNLLKGPATKQIATQLKMFAGMSIEQLVAMTKTQAASFAGAGDDFKKAIEAMDTIPLYILVPLLDSYMKGTLPVFEAYMAAGWDGVATLYRAPPESTEQVLHPKDKLIGKRDLPVAIDLGAGPAGYKEIHSEVIGELGWRVYFMLWEHPKANDAAAGWDGDRVAVYQKGDQLVGLIATTWDSVSDAQDFATAYRETLKKRYPGKAPVQVERKGKDVFIVDGSGQAGLMAVVRKANKTPVKAQPNSTIVAKPGSGKDEPAAGKGGDANAKLKKLANRACACKSKSCGNKVLDDFVAFAKAYANASGDQEAANQQGQRLGKCLIEAGVDSKVLMDKLNAAMK